MSDPIARTPLSPPTARPSDDQHAAIDTIAAALACGLSRPRLRTAITELAVAGRGTGIEPRLDLALLDALRTLEALLSGPTADPVGHHAPTPPAKGR